MKKRILSILLALCMLFCLVPTTAFAAGETNRKVETEQELVDALSDGSVDVITLKNDIAISTTLTVDRAVTLDIYGYMLEMTGSGSVIKVKSGGHLTLKDSDPTSTYKFTPEANGLWKWSASGTKTVNGGVIYGGNAGYGGGVHIEAGGRFIMNGGSIVGCLASRDSSGYGGGVYVIDGGAFEMNDGAAIIGCVAVDGYGGGVHIEADGRFTMNGGTIRDCTAFTAGAISYRGKTPLTLNGKIIAGSNDITGHPDPGVTGNTISISGVSNLILGDKADIQADISVSICTIHANGGVVRGNVSSYSESTVCVDEGVSGGTIIYGQIRGSYISVDGPAVTYKVNGEDYAIQILRSGSTATKPDSPTKMGHSFDGWYTADGTKWDFNTAVTEKLTLTGSLYVPVTSEPELVAALADGTADVIRLTKDIDISSSLTILRKVTLDLNGYVLKMTGSGSVIILDDKNGTTTGNLTLIDSNPTAEHKFKVNGVEPWVLDDSGTETVYGGIITGGTGSRIFFSNGVEGGGMIIGSGALTMNGGNIVGCIAKDGGGLFLSDGSFTMNAGSIVGCSTPDRSTTGEAFYGGIYAFGPMANGVTTGVITLTGGLIKNNGKYAINAVYKTTIYANGGEVYGGVDLNQACKITCLAEDNGITAFKGKTVIGGASGVNASHVDWGLFYGGLYIYGNTTGVIVTYKDGDSEYAKQVLLSGTLATRPDDPTKPGYIFEGWYTSDGARWNYTTAVTENITVTARWTLKTQSVSSEQELNDALADISVGKILLTADIDISSSLTVNRKVTLDLNGYVLRYADTTANGSVFKIISGGDLTVIDSRPDAEHRFNSDNILWAPDEQNGKEIVMGGVITGGTGTPCYVNGSSYFVACGGGVYLEGDARFTMDGGNIVGCIANTGGGVHISENGSFTMNGGSIMGCSSWNLSGPGGTPYFGGVYLDSGTFTMTGGIIKDCAKYSVVLNENATMNANGGEIYGVVEVGKNSYVTCLDGLTGVTAFRDNFWIYHNSARVDWGIFYGGITNYYSDPIIGLTATYMNGETIYARQILPSGTLATCPDTPATTPGCTFGGWNKADGTAWDYASDKVTDNITLYAKWTANTYTITFDTAGGSEIAPITQDYGTVITAPADPTREGYTFKGWDREIPATMPAENMTLKAQWKDIEKPTGEIVIGTNKWQEFLNKLTFGLFFKDTQTVTISAADNSGTVFISYLVTDRDLSEAEL